MNAIMRKSVTDYQNWMDKQIESNFPLSEEQWEQVTIAEKKIVSKFPVEVQSEVRAALFDVMEKWEIKFRKECMGK